jgi:hypothetical protein
MYYPPNYLNREILEKILSEYEWPASYTIGDDDCPFDGIEVVFPKCSLFFREGSSGDIDILFSHLQTNTDYGLSISHAVYYVFRPELIKNSEFKEPEYYDTSYPFTSIEKVENGVRNMCILLQTFLLSCIKGDFSWVEKYKIAISNA